MTFDFTAPSSITRKLNTKATIKGDEVLSTREIKNKVKLNYQDTPGKKLFGKKTKESVQLG